MSTCVCLCTLVVSRDWHQVSSSTPSHGSFQDRNSHWPWGTPIRKTWLTGECQTPLSTSPALGLQTDPHGGLTQWGLRTRTQVLMLVWSALYWLAISPSGKAFLKVKSPRPLFRYSDDYFPTRFWQPSQHKAHISRRKTLSGNLPAHWIIEKDNVLIRATWSHWHLTVPWSLTHDSAWVGRLLSIVHRIQIKDDLKHLIKKKDMFLWIIWDKPYLYNGKLETDPTVNWYHLGKELATWQIQYFLCLYRLVMEKPSVTSFLNFHSGP